jgi:pimeloyl-ACP methyl ester carboxylesterase
MSVRPPKVRYTENDGVSIAYTVVGDGPIDVLCIPGFVSHLEVFWEAPGIERYFGRLASFSRLITFDKRGQGLSDRPPGAPTLAALRAGADPRRDRGVPHRQEARGRAGSDAGDCDVHRHR